MTDLSAALSADLDAAVPQFLASRPVLVGSDFDGVISPLVDDPALAGPLPESMAALRALARLDGVHVALVSGRDLRSLEQVTGVTEVDGIDLIASHGAQSTCAAVREAMAGATLSDADAARLADLTREVETVIRERHPMARLEYKAAAVAVHTRGLPDDVASDALATALAIGMRTNGVRAVPGKDVVELSVSHADKGAAFTALARHVGARAGLYLGDDRTDEDVFALLTGPNDISVKVGLGESVARYRVADESAVTTLLTHLVEITTTTR